MHKTKYICASLFAIAFTACNGPIQPASPYGQNTYGPSAYGQAAYHQTYYGQNPYGQAQFGHTQYNQGQYNQGQYSQMPYGHVEQLRPRSNPNYDAAYAPARPYQRRQSVNVNYEALNAFEAPLALELGDVTFALNGRTDAEFDYSFETNDGIDGALFGNYQVSAETQLPNRITVGVVYGGAFEAFSGDQDYEDNIAGYAGGTWGTVFGGNVSDLVFEETRRLRGVTPVRLSGDGALGELNDLSGGYRGRYGPVIISGLVDENGNYDAGISFQRPIGNKDYRFTARHNDGTITTADGLTELDTRSVSGVGEYIYGSTRFDVSAGYEEIEEADRWFTSGGFSTKKGVWSLSAEGLYGQIDGQDEFSAVVGVKRDLARGLAATLALDFEDRQINVNGVDYFDAKDTRLVGGLSYGF